MPVQVSVVSASIRTYGGPSGIGGTILSRNSPTGSPGCSLVFKEEAVR